MIYLCVCPYRGEMIHFTSLPGKVNYDKFYYLFTVQRIYTPTTM